MDSSVIKFVPTFSNEYNDNLSQIFLLPLKKKFQTIKKVISALVLLITPFFSRHHASFKIANTWRQLNWEISRLFPLNKIY